MDNEHETKSNAGGNKERGFFANLLFGLLQDLVKYVIAFSVGTGAGAIACWYYGVPMVFSLLGGVLVLGLALTLTSDSIFS